MIRLLTGYLITVEHPCLNNPKDFDVMLMGLYQAIQEGDGHAPERPPVAEREANAPELPQQADRASCTLEFSSVAKREAFALDCSSGDNWAVFVLWLLPPSDFENSLVNPSPGLENYIIAPSPGF